MYTDVSSDSDESTVSMRKIILWIEDSHGLMDWSCVDYLWIIMIFLSAV